MDTHSRKHLAISWVAVVTLTTTPHTLRAEGTDQVNVTVITSEQRMAMRPRVDQDDSYHFVILNLDSATNLESTLSRGLPTSKREAKQVIEQRIQTIGRPQLSQRVLEAYRPLLTAMSLGLDRHPAVIFDNQAVVYGVSDVSTAIHHYEQWRNSREGR